MLTDGPQGDAEGVRIAATRAGQHNGDGDYELEEDFDRPAPPGIEGRVRRVRGTRSAPRVEESGPERTRILEAPPVPAPGPSGPGSGKPGPSGPGGGKPGPSGPGSGKPGPRPVSPERAKVLRQRRRRRRLLIAFTAFTAFCNLLVGLGYVYVQRKLGQISRIDLPVLAEDTAGGVMNVLLVGSDSRANVSDADAAGFGRDQVSGQRSDTMMILHVDPTAQKAAIVSVPRDLYVPIADTNYSDRVNAAFALGGPGQLIATVQRALGITIHHYVQVDFVGFKDIVDTVGGVTMYVPYPARDSGSGLDLGRDGCWELDGNKGLAWVRSRNMEFLIDGRWQADGRGDLGRIERQQDFIRRMMKKALSQGITNPLTLNRLISVGVRDVTFDSALSTKDLTALGRRFSSLDPDRVVLRTLPTDPADIDGKSVLKLQVAQAQPMIDLLNGRAPLEVTPTTVAGTETTTTTVFGTGSVEPSDVEIRVLNGVGTAGAAAKAGAGLTSAGFTVADKGDAPALAPKTTLTYAAGQEDKARLVQSALLAPAVLREDATLRSVDVILTLGADYGGIRPSVSAGTSPTTVAPTTTVPPQINPVPLPRGTTTPPC